MVTVLLLAALAANPGGRAEFERASRLYAEARYEDALPWFEKAYARSGHRPSVIFGLAQCERRLGMLDEAEAHLEEFIEVAPARRRDRGRRLLAKVRAEKTRRALAALPKAPAKVAALPKAPSPPPPKAAAPWVPPPAEVEREAPEPEPQGGLLSSPVFWIVSGAIVAAGAATAAVLVTRSGSAPYGGSSGEVFEP